MNNSQLTRPLFSASLGQGMPVIVNGDPPHIRRLVFQRKTELGLRCIQNLNSLRHDFRADTVSGQYESIDNTQSMDTPQGAGIQGAETVARLGPQCVITGNCGPKAFRVLTAAGITVFIADAITVADAIEQFRAGRLVAAFSAEV